MGLCVSFAGLRNFLLRISRSTKSIQDDQFGLSTKTYNKSTIGVSCDSEGILYLAPATGDFCLPRSSQKIFNTPPKSFSQIKTQSSQFAKLILSLSKETKTVVLHRLDPVVEYVSFFLEMHRHRLLVSISGKEEEQTCEWTRFQEVASK